MATPAFAIEEFRIDCRSNGVVEITFHYVNSAKSIALKITPHQDQPHQPHYHLQLIHVVSAPRLLHILKMNSYPYGPYDFDRISGNYAAGSSFTGAASENASASANHPTVQLSADDSDSDDLLKYIPYLDELEKIEKIAAEQQEKDRADGTYLLKLLDTGDFDQGLVKEFKTMINMTKHMNSMLFKGDKASGFKVRTPTLNQVEIIAVQIIHYFDKLSDQFDVGIDKIVEIKQYLPSLASRVKADSVRTALKVWNTKILGYAYLYFSSLTSPQLLFTKKQKQKKSYTNQKTFHSQRASVPSQLRDGALRRLRNLLRRPNLPSVPGGPQSEPQARDVPLPRGALPSHRPLRRAHDRHLRSANPRAQEIQEHHGARPQASTQQRQRHRKTISHRAHFQDRQGQNGT